MAFVGGVSVRNHTFIIGVTYGRGSKEDIYSKSQLNSMAGE
jgi:hypothetical protein